MSRPDTRSGSSDRSDSPSNTGADASVSDAPASAGADAAASAGADASVSAGAAVPSRAGTAARASDLVKVYGSGSAEVRALDGVSLEVPAGAFTAVMGPSGSGKSTLMHCLAALDTPTSGEVEIAGVRLTGLSDRELTRLRRDRIGFVFQSFNLLPTLSAAENICLPRRLAGERPDASWLDEVVDRVRLRDRLSHRPSELSGGQQQRVAVARALASKPDIVFADEPTGNLDTASSNEVLGFMRQSVTDFGQTVVMVTHDAHAASYAEQVVFLADGKVIDTLDAPTAESVLDRMKALGEAG